MAESLGPLECSGWLRLGSLHPLILQAITSVRGVALHALKLHTSSPPATFLVLKAVLLLLGRDPTASACPVGREVAVSQLHVGVFEELAACDATRGEGCGALEEVRLESSRLPMRSLSIGLLPLMGCLV